MTGLREDLLVGRRVALGAGVGGAVSGLPASLGASVGTLADLDSPARDQHNGHRPAFDVVVRDAEAARAALENLARTLSAEWARYGITVTAIAPGRSTTDDEVASLVAFLTSVAGDYYSGCRFELGAIE